MFGVVLIWIMGVEFEYVRVFLGWFFVLRMEMLMRDILVRIISDIRFRCIKVGWYV